MQDMTVDEFIMKTVKLCQISAKETEETLNAAFINPRHEVEGGYRFRCRLSVRHSVIPSFRHSVIPSVCPEIVSGA